MSLRCLGRGRGPAGAGVESRWAVSRSGPGKGGLGTCHLEPGPLACHTQALPPFTGRGAGPITSEDASQCMPRLTVVGYEGVGRVVEGTLASTCVAAGTSGAAALSGSGGRWRLWEPPILLVNWTLGSVDQSLGQGSLSRSRSSGWGSSLPERGDRTPEQEPSQKWPELLQALSSSGEPAGT